MSIFYSYQDTLSEAGNKYLNACDTTQHIVNAYYSCAHSYNNDFAWSRSPIYTTMHRAAVLAIRETYGLSALKAERVLDVITDTGEYDVTRAVGYVRAYRASRAYSR